MNMWFKVLLMTFLIGGLSYYLISILVDIDKEKVRIGIRKSRLYINTIDFTNKRIMESNIRHYIKGYTTPLHFIFAVLCFSLSYFILTTYPQRYRVLLSGILFFMPWTILQIIDYRTNALTKKQTGDFIISFQEMYSVEDDVFQSFKKLEEGLSYPLLGGVKEMNRKYQIGIPAEDCFEGFKEQFSDEMMRTFVAQLAVAYETGGSVRSICDNFIREITRAEENEDQDKVNQIVDRYGIYLVLAFNILMLHLGMQRDVLFRFVTETKIGQVTLISNYVLTGWILVKMLKSS